LLSVVTGARAVVWNAATGVGARIIGLVCTLVLARFICPDEYRQVSTAAICVLTASRCSNLEFGQYLIANNCRKRGVPRNVLTPRPWPWSHFLSPSVLRL